MKIKNNTTQIALTTLMAFCLALVLFGSAHTQTFGVNYKEISIQANLSPQRDEATT